MEETATAAAGTTEHVVLVGGYTLTLGSRCEVSGGSSEGEKRNLRRSDGDGSLRQKTSMKRVACGNGSRRVGEEDSVKNRASSCRNRAVDDPKHVLCLDACEERE